MEIENQKKITRAILVFAVLVFFELQILYLFKLMRNNPEAKSQGVSQNTAKNKESKLIPNKGNKATYGPVDRVENGLIFLKWGEITAKIQITESTRIAKIQMTESGEKKETPISLSEIVPGNTVIIKATEAIKGNEIVAAEVFVTTPKVEL